MLLCRIIYGASCYELAAYNIRRRPIYNGCVVFRIIYNDVAAVGDAYNIQDRDELLVMQKFFFFFNFLLDNVSFL